MVSKYGPNDLATKQTQIMDMEDRLVFAGGGAEGSGMDWSLGLVNADYCVWTG